MASMLTRMRWMGTYIVFISYWLAAQRLSFRTPEQAPESSRTSFIGKALRNLPFHDGAGLCYRDPVRTALILLCGIAVVASGADAPEAAISNGTLNAKLYLPDSQNG